MVWWVAPLPSISRIFTNSLWPLLILSTCVFTPIYIIVYVDDIIVTGPSQPHLNKFISTLVTGFFLKDLGYLSYFLDMEVIRHSQGIVLSQSKYIHHILTKDNMLNSKPSSTPITSQHPLQLHCGPSLSNPTQYRILIRALQYLSLTRPDISFTVNKLS